MTLLNLQVVNVEYLINHIGFFLYTNHIGFDFHKLRKYYLSTKINSKIVFGSRKQYL